MRERVLEDQFEKTRGGFLPRVFSSYPDPGRLFRFCAAANDPADNLNRGVLIRLPPLAALEENPVFRTHFAFEGCGYKRRRNEIRLILTQVSKICRVARSDRLRPLTAASIMGRSQLSPCDIET